MKKISLGLAFLLIMTAQQVGAAKEPAATKSECLSSLQSCSQVSKNVVPTDSTSCKICMDICKKAKLACSKEEVVVQKEMLPQASAFHLWCVNKCPKVPAQSK